MCQFSRHVCYVQFLKSPQSRNVRTTFSSTMKFNKVVIALAIYVIPFGTCDDEYHPIPRTKSAGVSRNVDDDQGEDILLHFL